MDLAVQKREKFGKASKALRREGLIPAEIYGFGIENKHVSVNTKDFSRVFKEAGESTIVNLMFEGEKQPALIHDVERDRITHEITHIDFYKVRMDKKITADIPLRFVGESLAAKEKLGILNKAVSEVEVETLPADLPRDIEVDLSVLVDLDKSIHVRDLKVSDKVKILMEPDAVVVNLVQLRAEEVVEKPVDVSEVKVEGEEKRVEKSKESVEVEDDGGESEAPGKTTENKKEAKQGKQK